jgi:alkylated DNA repair dioxygenase AlkB
MIKMEIEVEELTVPGLYYVEDIKEDTTRVIQELDALQWTSLTNAKNSRQVQHYGYKYNYTTYNIREKCAELPEFLHVFRDLLTLICRDLELIDTNYVFNQCIINNYFTGQGISPHIDVKAYGSVIGCFTIGSGTTMVFEKDGQQVEVYVKPNSLYIMSGDSRYVWKHSMPSRKSDTVGGEKIERERRISLTFRNVPPS